MRCPRCQHENREGARFCEACGGPLTQTCPECGHRPRPGAAFCHHCGARLIEPKSSPPGESAARHPPIPASYTPSHLVEKILTSRSALEGERKQVTVLFADLKGSRELLAGLCQLSCHEGEADDVDRSNLVYAAAIIPINWANRS
jgi:hypothetical protein